MAELLPCPFCGSSSVGLVDMKDPQGRPTYTIICVHCGASINNYSTPQYAKKKWNKRPQKERRADFTCKDCTEWDNDECECSHWFGFKENDFCSYGTPKERGGEK